MAELVLERTGLPSRDFAEKVLAIFALQGQFGEVVPEAGGRFTLRAITLPAMVPLSYTVRVSRHPKGTTMLRLIGAVTLLAIAVLVVLTASAERDRPAAALAELDPSEKADRTAGFHCLSSWDGSLRPFREEVKAAMRNPSSFEHIGTRITPVNEDGTHLLYMTYRAENGFGGMNQGEAVAVVQNDTCSYETVTIERTIAP